VRPWRVDHALLFQISTQGGALCRLSCRQGAVILHLADLATAGQLGTTRATATKSSSSARTWLLNTQASPGVTQEELRVRQRAVVSHTAIRAVAVGLWESLLGTGFSRDEVAADSVPLTHQRSPTEHFQFSEVIIDAPDTEPVGLMSEIN
jgi:hypothetical protein